MKRLILRGIDFGSVLVASGTLNFFGEGWWYHWIYRILFFFGFNFSGTTFISKTTTFYPRNGNMPLRRNLQPKEYRPKCIKVGLRNFINGTVLNAVGLSGPGLEALLRTGRWQERKDPFFISIMAVGKTAEERLEEMRIFVKTLKDHLRYFSTKVGVQINISCPNAGHNQATLVQEAIEYLRIVQALNVPIDLKINALISVEAIKEIVSTDMVDSITVSNTIPWGELPDDIDWKGLFGSKTSPLAQYGGGGLSGAPLLALVGEWIRKARRLGIIIPIVAGGGILHPDDVDYLFDCGATVISIGSVAILRPWRIKRIIRRVYKIAERKAA